jgi:purine-binding chemotaxis protein CheW
MTPANTNRPDPGASEEHSADYVTLTLGEQMFGLPINRVHDVFNASQITHVPLAPREIVGLLNLRGRVVTALSLRARLGMPDLDRSQADVAEMAIGIEHGGEAYALMVDRIGEVLHLEADTFEPTPIHLDAAWVALARGVHRLADRLLVILDVDAVLDFDLSIAA